MHSAEDKKKESKVKQQRSENVKNVVQQYLQKRNYPTSNPVDIPKNEFQTYSSVQSEISNPNSVLYRFFNCDPVIIDTNFSKFLNWIKEFEDKETIADFEPLIGPLFCHLYLDILQGGHPEKAANFFLAHLTSVQNANKDTFIKELITNLSVENSSDQHTQEFRSNKYVVLMKEESKLQLMNFVKTSSHLIILQELNAWFDIQIMKDDNETAEVETDLIPNECCMSSKFQKILDAAAALENGPKNIYSVSVTNVISEINCGLLSRYHSWFVYNQDNLVYVNSLHSFNSLNAISNSSTARLNGHSCKVYALTISKNYLVSASNDGKICIYKTENFEVVKECTGHTRTVYCLKISKNEYYLASGSEDNTVRVWNVGNGQFLRIFVGHEQAVVSVDFHPNCLYLISGSCDNTVRFWAIQNGAPIRLFHGNKGTIRSVTCHPLGKILVSASDDQCIKLWDILNGKMLSETKCEGSYCKILAWSKDGNSLCGVFSDGNVRIWDLKIQENGYNLQQMQVINCDCTVIALEYCFGTFGVLTTKQNSQG